MNDRQKELRERAHDGLRAVVELLGGDPGSPRMATATEGYLATLEAFVGEQDRGLGALDQLMTRVLVMGPPTDRTPMLLVQDWSAVCDQHLVPYGGHIGVVYEPGEAGICLSDVQLEWVLSLLCTGLTSPQRIAERVLHHLHSRLGGAAVVRVLTYGSCPGLHSDHQTRHLAARGVLEHPELVDALSTFEDDDD